MDVETVADSHHCSSPSSYPVAHYILVSQTTVDCCARFVLLSDNRSIKSACAHISKYNLWQYSCRLGTTGTGLRVDILTILLSLVGKLKSYRENHPNILVDSWSSGLQSSPLLRTTVRPQRGHQQLIGDIDSSCRLRALGGMPKRIGRTLVVLSWKTDYYQRYQIGTFHLRFRIWFIVVHQIKIADQFSSVQFSSYLVEAVAVPVAVDRLARACLASRFRSDSTDNRGYEYSTTEPNSDYENDVDRSKPRK
jgi:hypothetical protein